MTIRRRKFNLKGYRFLLRWCWLSLGVLAFFLAPALHSTEHQMILHKDFEIKEEDDLRQKLPDDVWKHITSFLEKKERYVLGQLDRNPRVKYDFLKRTGTTKSFEEFERIFRLHRKQKLETKKNLQKKESFFYLKHSCLPIWYVAEAGATAVTWTAVGVSAVYWEVLRALAITTTACIIYTSEVVACSSYPEENTKDFVKDTCACLFYKKNDFTLRRCLFYQKFWEVKKPYERKEIDEQKLECLRQKLNDPPNLHPKKQKIQRD